MTQPGSAGGLALRLAAGSIIMILAGDWSLRSLVRRLWDVPHLDCNMMMEPASPTPAEPGLGRNYCRAKSPRAPRRVARTGCLVRLRRRFIRFPPSRMTKDETAIGLADLLAEIDRDLDDLRKKHPSDYGVKNTGLWWELERERLLTRHSPESVVKKLRRVRGYKWMMIWFFAGWGTMLCANAIIALVIR